MIVLHLLHTALYWMVVLPITGFLGALAILVGNLAPNSDMAMSLARLWARICLLLAGVRIRIEGLENIDSSRRYVIMCNHESSIDIPTVLLAVPPAIGISFLAKKALFEAPVLGRAMQALGFIPVDRNDKAAATGMFHQTLEAIDAGRSPLIFPESTRTKDGRLLPFKRGGFLLALKSGIEILPMGLEGPRVGMPDASVVIRPTFVTVRFGKPIDPSEYGVARRRELTEVCRASIDQLRGDLGHIHDGDAPKHNRP